jgi:hypothetical protein
MQVEHKLPPNGRSGRFFVLGSLAISESLPLGTPDKGFLQIPHLAGECFLFP